MIVLGDSPAAERSRNVVIARPAWLDTAVLTASRGEEAGTVRSDLVSRQPSDCVGYDVSGGAVTIQGVRSGGADLDVVAILRANATTLATWSVGIGDTANEADGTEAADASGNGHHGTLMGAPTFAAGKFGGALVLDADVVGQYIAAPSVATVTGSWTWMAHVYLVALPGQAFTLFDQDGLDSGGSRIVRLLGVGLTGLLLFDDNKGNDFTSTTGLIAGLWQHVAIVYDDVAKTITLYVDGDVVGTHAATAYAATDTYSTTSMGGIAGSTGFSGGLDDVRWYAAALAQADIQAEMQAETVTLPASLVLQYKLNAYQSGTLPFGAPPNLAEDPLRDSFLLLPYRMTNSVLRVTLTDPTNALPLRIGRAFAGPAWQPSKNFDWGYAFPAENDTKKTRTPTGATLSVERPNIEGFSFDVKLIPRVEMLAEGYRLRKLLGLSGECLVCLDPGDDSFLQLQLRYGQFKEMPTIAPDFYDGWRMSFAVEELR